MYDQKAVLIVECGRLHSAGRNFGDPTWEPLSFLGNEQQQTPQGL
jgi:hypothetical protein